MAWWYRYIGTWLVAAGMGVATVALGQDANDPAAAAQGQPSAQTSDPQAAIQPAQDSELAAEVQQLRGEVDTLKSQVAQLYSIIEQLQAAQTVPAPTKVASASPKPVAPARGKKPAPTSAKATPAPSSAPAVQTDEQTPLTVLVFKDGRRMEARNYAIVGQTLWIYTEDDSKKTPVSELDVAATKNANADRGIVFQLPPSK